MNYLITDGEIVDGHFIKCWSNELGVFVMHGRNAERSVLPPISIAVARGLHRHLGTLLHLIDGAEKTARPVTTAEHERALSLGVTVEQMRRSDVLDAETAVLLQSGLDAEASTLLKPKEFEAEVVGSIHAADSPWAGIEPHHVLGGES